MHFEWTLAIAILHHSLFFPFFICCFSALFFLFFFLPLQALAWVLVLQYLQTELTFLTILLTGSHWVNRFNTALQTFCIRSFLFPRDPKQIRRHLALFCCMILFEVQPSRHETFRVKGQKQEKSMKLSKCGEILHRKTLLIVLVCTEVNLIKPALWYHIWYIWYIYIFSK